MPKAIVEAIAEVSAEASAEVSAEVRAAESAEARVVKGAAETIRRPADPTPLVLSRGSRSIPTCRRCAPHLTGERSRSRLALRRPRWMICRLSRSSRRCWRSKVLASPSLELGQRRLVQSAERSEEGTRLKA